MAVDQPCRDGLSSAVFRPGCVTWGSGSEQSGSVRLGTALRGCIFVGLGAVPPWSAERTGVVPPAGSEFGQQVQPLAVFFHRADDDLRRRRQVADECCGLADFQLAVLQVALENAAPRTAAAHKIQ